MLEPGSPSPPSPPSRFEGPFKKRLVAEKPTLKGWLSPWRIYSIGAIAALGVTAVYLLKFTVTPEILDRAAAHDAEPPPPPPKGSVGAYCLQAQGGMPAPVPPAPFCTEARPPGCRAGDALQLTYTPLAPEIRFVYGAVVGEDKRPLELMPRSREVRAGTADVPLGQWPVLAKKARSAAAILVLFSRDAIESADVKPWLEAWRREQLLSRPPELTPAIAAKGATLSAFLVCLGK
jgi:hypothetical protein